MKLRIPWSHLPIAIPLILLAPLPVTAQAGPAEAERIDAAALKKHLIAGFERAKQMELAFVRAIPDSALRWSPTPDVRDFAEQVAHTAENPFIVQSVFGEASAPAFGDTAVVLNDKDALADAVKASYDWVLERLRALPPEKLAEQARVFGQLLPKWQILAFSLEHATWTRGQLVPYFRLNGLAPPAVQFF